MTDLDELTEKERLPTLVDKVTQDNYERVCLYLLSCAPYEPNPDNDELIDTAKKIYLKFGKDVEALRCALMLNNIEMVTEIFSRCSDPLVKKQMAILLGRHQTFLEIEDPSLAELNSNLHLSEYFKRFARELDVMEPKTHEEVYRRHLEPKTLPNDPAGPAAVSRRRENIAASFVNGLVNCGFGSDKLMPTDEMAKAWFANNREYGLFFAVASLGMLYRWDVQGGFARIQPLLEESDNEYIKGGRLLSLGIVASGVEDPIGVVGALLMEYIKADKVPLRIGAILGLGIAFANSKRENVLKSEPGCIAYELREVLNDNSPLATPEVKGLVALALGFILVGTADFESAGDLLNHLLEAGVNLEDPNYKFFSLAIGLIFYETQERAEFFVESVRVLPPPFGRMTATLIDACAFAGTGNVLKIQDMLHLCSERFEEDDSDSTATPIQDLNDAIMDDADDTAKKPDESAVQAVAVLGIGLIAMGEEVGSQMCQRTFAHLFRYGEPAVKRAVPLALALTSVSDPKMSIVETLSKYTHDADRLCARNAVFAMGLIGAGTNNARLASMYRKLISYHSKDPTTVLITRISQGLTHMGKGTMTLNPQHSDRQLLCPAVVASLLSVCFAFLDSKNTIMGLTQHYLLYMLAVAIQPRMLVTLIEEEEEGMDGEVTKTLKPIGVSVRVGQAVDVVAQPGKPRTITGFVTQTTPVLMAYGERAELATDDYIALSPNLEGVVIVKKRAE